MLLKDHRCIALDELVIVSNTYAKLCGNWAIGWKSSVWRLKYFSEGSFNQLFTLGTVSLELSFSWVCIKAVLMLPIVIAQWCLKTTHGDLGEPHAPETSWPHPYSIGARCQHYSQLLLSILAAEHSHSQWLACRNTPGCHKWGNQKGSEISHLLMNVIS